MEKDNDRRYWIRVTERICEPVLDALAKGRLRATMPVEGTGEDRSDYACLEALGRTLAGIAPWLELEGGDDKERQLRQRFAALARAAIDAGTNPDSPDFMNFSRGGQPIVDAAFLAQAILRAPRELWRKLDDPVKQNVAAALKETRRGRKPVFSNWLLFSAMIETALMRMGEEWDRMRVDYALRQHEQWYVGDGAYSDGPSFHWDYYNSFVIHPMLVDIVLRVGDEYPEWARLKGPMMERARRFAEIQERMISPEGTYPPMGRSLAYRFGAFHALAHMALLRQLPQSVSPAQVRCALTAVIRRTIEAPGTFDEHGWLRIGLIGSQPGLGEGYISTGSLYLCAVALLPLGLPPDDPFWSGEAVPWTAQKIWSGEDAPADSALP